MTIYVSAAWFAKYHTDIPGIYHELECAVKTFPFHAYAHMSNAEDQIGITWTDNSAVPLDTAARLQTILDNTTALLTDLDPDMISASTSAGDRHYTLYWTYDDCATGSARQ